MVKTRPVRWTLLPVLLATAACEREAAEPVNAGAELERRRESLMERMDAIAAEDEGQPAAADLAGAAADGETGEPPPAGPPPRETTPEEPEPPGPGG